MTTDVNAKDEDGGTPLHAAAAHNPSPAVLEVLLKAGADV
ncbi:MAG: ankyrin repeat domain-containing protein, partial [Planctomycetota bacterium]